MKNPLYIIVHPVAVDGAAIASEEAQKVLVEIDRIQEQEDYVLCLDDYSEITRSLPNGAKAKQIMVCGAFGGRNGNKFCVDTTCEILKDCGYQAMVYEPGTLFSGW